MHNLISSRISSCPIGYAGYPNAAHGFGYSGFASYPHAAGYASHSPSAGLAPAPVTNFVGGYVVAGSYVAKSVERKVKYNWTEHTQCSPMNKTPVLSMI